MTPEEITEALACDTRPSGPDGCSNVDRIAFVCQVFDLEQLDLTLAYDFTPVIGVTCPFNVEAAKHLAILKLDFINRLYDNYHMDQAHYESVSAPLIGAIRRIDWHLRHVAEGVPTPPFRVFD